jgi:hypothetical protein
MPQTRLAAGCEASRLRRLKARESGKPAASRFAISRVKDSRAAPETLVEAGGGPAGAGLLGEA